MEQIKFFVYGMSGSGKDTVSNYLRDKKGFLKLRIADTIKRIICEAKNMSFEELEEQKRNNSTLRELHYVVSKILDDIAGFEQSSTNRLKQLINGKAFDYQYADFNSNKIICDVRTEEEINILLKAGWVGIFLERTTQEYKNSCHFTEQNIFLNGIIHVLKRNYLKQIIIIDNSSIFEKDINCDFDTDGTSEELIKIIDLILKKDNVGNIDIIDEEELSFIGTDINTISEQHSCYYMDVTRNK